MPMKKLRRRSRLWEFDRSMLRGAFASLFWVVISERRRGEALTMQALADSLSVDKSVVSRWFGSPPPNWTLNTISDLAHVLNVEMEVVARDRSTGIIYTPTGPAKRQQPSTGSGAGIVVVQMPPSSPQTSGKSNVATSDSSDQPLLIAA